MPRLSLSDSRLRRRSYLICYSLAFLVLALIVYSPFWLNSKSLIWKPDGLTQHFNALVYFRSWLRSFLKTLVLEHRFELPLWDYSIGYGSDILTTLHYYVIGDPLNLLAVITPSAWMEPLYCGLIFVRLYLAGLSFSCFASRMGCRGGALLAGSLSYCFCAYAFVLGSMHPYFLNPMICLPLLLLGAEKVLQRESGHLLIFSTALSAVSNFYFFYMLAILTGLYCLIRCCTLRQGRLLPRLLSFLGRCLLFAGAGTAIAAVILLPILLVFASDLRSANSLANPLLYGAYYYEGFLDGFVSTDFTAYYTYMGFTGLALLAVLLLFLKRDRQDLLPLKIGFLLLTLLLLLPAAGSAMNGFSYSCNRWCFGYAFLVSFILARLWPDLLKLTRREQRLLGVLLLAFIVVSFLAGKTGSANAWFSLAVSLLAPALLSGYAAMIEQNREGLNDRLNEETTKQLAEELTDQLNEQQNKVSNKDLATQRTDGLMKRLAKLQARHLTASRLLLLLLGINLSANALFYYNTNEEATISRFVDAGEGLSTLESTASSMLSVFLEDQNETFYRSAQEPVKLRNDYLNYGTRTIQYYWSLSNGAISQYFNELALPFTERPFKYSSLDGRTALQALASVRYYVRHDPADYLPYSYTEISPNEYEGEVYYMAETDLYLPFGYTYDSYISRDTYEQLSYPQRQEALTQGLVCETVPEGYAETSLSFSEQSLNYELTYDTHEIWVEDDRYYALTDNAVLTLTFESPAAAETYLLIEGMTAASMTDYDFYTTEPFASIYAEEWQGLSAYEQRKIKLADREDTPVSAFPVTCASTVRDSAFTYYAAMTESAYDRSDYLLNMGYAEDGQTTITITLPCQGVYSFEKLEVLSIPMEPLTEQIETRRAESLENVTFDTDRITGTIHLTADRLLCLSLPYSSGWRATVDGQEAELFQANTMYMGLALTAGDHTITLYYRTPGLKTGLAVSACGLIFWAGYAGYRLRRRRTRHTI